MRIKITEPDLQIRYLFCPTWQGILDEVRTLLMTNKFDFID